MLRCFDLARKGIPHVEPNPPVGAVIVYQNKIIGEGFHAAHGQNHAEANAILDVRPADLINLPQSCIYVSLEPCCTTGLTPPCVNLILEHKIPEVVISCLDPNPEISGKSVAILKENGVKITTGILEEEGKTLIAPFRKRMEKKLPYVTLKVATDQNGNIASEGKSIWLTNKLSKTYVHNLRSKSRAILVGTNTYIIDNPSLNNRLYTGPSPQRIVVDRHLEIPKSHKLFNDGIPTTLFTELSNTELGEHIEIRQLNPEKALSEDILEYLYHSGINSLLVEGGAKVIQGFFMANCWDELIIIKTKNIIRDSPISISLEKGEIIDQFTLGQDQICIRKNLN